MGRRALRKINPNLDLSPFFRAEVDLPGRIGPATLPTNTESPEPTLAEPVPLGSVLPADVADEEDRPLFSRAAPVEIEVGSGKGLFLYTAAGAWPEHNFLGIELAEKYAKYSAARLARAGRTNALMIGGDAVRIFHERIETACAAAVHVYFPDPWWKARHRKRRVMNEQLLADIERVLLPGGTLHFWTDVEEYFLTSLELIAQVTRLTGPHAVPETPATSDLDYRTHFERRTRLHGLPVYRAEFRKVGT